jgi:hypothetical protein
MSEMSRTCWSAYVVIKNIPFLNLLGVVGPVGCLTLSKYLRWLSSSERAEHQTLPQKTMKQKHNCSAMLCCSHCCTVVDTIMSRSLFVDPRNTIRGGRPEQKVVCTKAIIRFVSGSCQGRVRVVSGSCQVRVRFIPATRCTLHHTVPHHQFVCSQ